MAEIRIERKGRGLGWLWLLLALVVVAVLAWYFLYPGRPATPPATGAPPTTGALGRPAPRTAGLIVASSRIDGWQVSPGGRYGEEG